MAKTNPRSSTTRTSRRRIAGERTGVQTRNRPLHSVAPAVPTGDRQDQEPANETEGSQVTAPKPQLSVVTPELATTEAPETTDAELAPPARAAQPAKKGPSSWLLAGLAVVAAAVVAAAVSFALPAWRAHAVELAQQSAPSVAERAARQILSYDYTTLPADEKAAESYLTPSYQKQYEHTFSLIKKNAPRLKAKVTAQVLGSGISQADADHAHVLVFVNQTTKSTANAAPQVALNRVMFHMVKQGGSWRVNGITAY